ncbi:MAG: hypothetical protein CM1200mP2_24020 [Planctomycetaceae bacterium]|nr:MAG: hypothetical protein CM1200mP2_24020 [Planctomycetaceae bacterium]
MLGTADYLAPNRLSTATRWMPGRNLQSRLTMYFLLTGRPPFNEGTLAQRLMWHQPSLRRRFPNRADVPERLAEIVSTMMAKDADNRFQTARDVAEHLTAWIGDGTASRLPSLRWPAAVPVAHPSSHRLRLLPG